MVDVCSRRCAGVAILSLVASFATANDDPLTLAEAQQVAAAQSEKLTASELMRAAAEQLTPTAKLLPDPVLRVALENVPVTGPDRFSLNNDFMTMSRVGVSQEFTRAGKRELRGERAQQSVAVADAEREMTLASVRRDTALAWLAAYYSQRQHDLIAEQLLAAQSAAAAVESAFAQGRDSSVDALAARAAAVQMQDQLADAAYRVRIARVNLSRWIGDDAQRPLTTRPPIDALPLHAHQDLTQLQAQLREHP